VRLATVMVGDVATAGDIVQDGFERLHRSWHRLRGADGPGITSAAMFEPRCDVIAAAPRGTNLLASCGRFGRFGRIGVNGFTPLA
jgi:hypothetical protein